MNRLRAGSSNREKEKGREIASQITNSGKESRTRGIAEEMLRKKEDHWVVIHLPSEVRFRKEIKKKSGDCSPTDGLIYIQRTRNHITHLKRGNVL